MPSNDQGFYLGLGDGQSWRLLAENGSGPWLERLAKVMGLSASAGPDAPRYLFRRMDRDGDGLPAGGWERRSPGLIEFWTHPEIDDVVCGVGPIEDHKLQVFAMWLSLLPIYERAIGRGGMPVHAAMLEIDGQAVILAAPGDTGKTTCCERVPPPWKPWCDDEVLIVRGDRGQLLAHAFPTWSDRAMRRSERTWRVERSLPIKAIFFLERGDNDRAKRLGRGQASVMLRNSAAVMVGSWLLKDHRDNKRAALRLFDNACSITGEVPAFALEARKEGRFWEEMTRALDG